MKKVHKTGKTMKVSVCIRTYNHEDFIEQAVKSVLRQKTDFSFEVLVGEDGSSDSTRDRLKAMAVENPNCFLMLASDSNLGPKHTMVRLYTAARGEYISMLDGDDFWIGDLKLQRQTDFLDAHPEVSICGHRWRNIDMSKSPPTERDSPLQKERASLNDLINGYFLKHSSTMIRKAILPTLPPWIFDSPSTDIAIQLACVLAGPMACINDVMVGYRIHPGSVFSGKTKIEKSIWNLRNWEVFQNCVPQEYLRAVERKLASMYYSMAWMYRNSHLNRKEHIFLRKAWGYDTTAGMIISKAWWRLRTVKALVQAFVKLKPL